ncbi:MAG: hypothetical protein ACYTFQ_29050, partial [Planctomycetota bacterium]
MERKRRTLIACLLPVFALAAVFCSTTVFAVEEKPFSYVGPLMAKADTSTSILPSLSGLSVGSDGTAGVNEGGGYTQEQINEMINNPLGELWILFGQN